MVFFIHDQVLQEKVLIEHCPTLNMCADFFTKPLQGMLFYRLRDLIMNIAPESHHHSSHRSVLRDTGEGLNKSNENPAQGTEEVYNTSSGACVSARKENIPTHHNNSGTRDGVSCDVHTHPITRINLKKDKNHIRKDSYFYGTVWCVSNNKNQCCSCSSCPAKTVESRWKWNESYCRSNLSYCHRKTPFLKKRSIYSIYIIYIYIYISSVIASSIYV